MSILVDTIILIKNCKPKLTSQIILLDENETLTISVFLMHRCVLFEVLDRYNYCYFHIVYGFHNVGSSGDSVTAQLLNHSLGP